MIGLRCYNLGGFEANEAVRAECNRADGPSRTEKAEFLPYSKVVAHGPKHDEVGDQVAAKDYFLCWLSRVFYKATGYWQGRGYMPK